MPSFVQDLLNSSDLFWHTNQTSNLIRSASRCRFVEVIKVDDSAIRKVFCQRQMTCVRVVIAKMELK